MASPKVDLKSVEDFWSVEACGTHFVTEFDGLRDFYDKYREYRYRTLWFIHELIPFSEAKDKDLLEIGCGNGADGVEFARHGARYTGVDLTETAVEATRNHFAILGLDGTFQTENAEQLSFPDNSFDLVYSMGVLHHTPNPDRAFAQVHRVLRPGGRAIIMLYHKNSFNYYARIMGFMRLKVFLKILRRRRHWAEDRAALERDDRTGLRGNEDQGVWDVHYRNFLEEGCNYLTPDRFVHHCADGPECPYAFVYSSRSAKRAFSMFTEVKCKVAHFPLRQYFSVGVPLFLERAAASTMGWNLMLYARK